MPSQCPQSHHLSHPVIGPVFTFQRTMIQRPFPQMQMQMQIDPFRQTPIPNAVTFDATSNHAYRTLGCM